MNKILEVIGDTIIIAAGIVFVYLFAGIAVTGGYVAVEPRRPVLVTELVLAALIILIGINRFIDDLKKAR